MHSESMADREYQLAVRKMERLQNEVAELKRTVQRLDDTPEKFEAIWRTYMTILPERTKDRALLASMIAEVATCNISVRAFARKYRVRQARAGVLQRHAKEVLHVMQSTEDVIQVLYDGMQT